MMQSRVAHARKCRAAADLLRLGFETGCGSRPKSAFDMVNKEVLSLSMSSSGKDEKMVALLDGRINFRARKTHCSDLPKCIHSAPSLPLPSTDSGSCPRKDATPRKYRTKRGATSQKCVERRVTRRKKAVATPMGLIMESPVTSEDISNTSAVDFWHSSLSEDAGVVDLLAVSPVVASIIPRNTILASEDLAVAIQHLKCADSRLRTVIEMHDGPKFEKCSSAFTALVRSIVFQQLATKAASAIFGRVVVLCGGLDNLQPVAISELSKEQLRAVGISERKASYLHDLAAHFMSGSLTDVSISKMNDDDLMIALTAVRGIGVWSVHMFMLFSLHRPDVLPVGDLGVRKGFQKLYELKALPSPAEMERLSSCWQPYRSIGSWYMWRVLDMKLPF